MREHSTLMSLEDKCLNNYNDNDLPTTTWQDIITEKWSQTLFCVLSYRSSHYCLIVAPKMFNPLLISQNTNWITNSSRPKAGIKTHIKAFKWSFRLWPKTPTDVFFFQFQDHGQCQRKTRALPTDSDTKTTENHTRQWWSFLFIIIFICKAHTCQWCGCSKRRGPRQLLRAL